MYSYHYSWKQAYSNQYGLAGLVFCLWPVTSHSEGALWEDWLETRSNLILGRIQPWRAAISGWESLRILEGSHGIPSPHFSGIQVIWRGEWGVPQASLSYTPTSLKLADHNLPCFHIRCLIVQWRELKIWCMKQQGKSKLGNPAIHDSSFHCIMHETKPIRNVESKLQPEKKNANQHWHTAEQTYLIDKKLIKYSSSSRLLTWLIAPSLIFWLNHLIKNGCYSLTEGHSWVKSAIHHDFYHTALLWLAQAFSCRIIAEISFNSVSSGKIPRENKKQTFLTQ